MFASQTGDKPSQHAVVLPMEVSDLPTPELVRAMGEIIHHVFRPALHGLPSPPEQQAIIFSFHEELFGHAVEQTWSREYLLLIEVAKRRRLEHRANAAIRNQDAHAASAAAGNGLMSPEQVLKAAREVTNLNPESCRMPAYADDPELVAWLIARMGFEGGGGRAAMTSRKLKELVLDPAALADAIDRFADRLAERLRDRPDEPDDNGELCEPEAQWGRDRLTQLAARVRERGALVARPVRPSSEHQRPPKYAVATTVQPGEPPCRSRCVTSRGVMPPIGAHLRNDYVRALPNVRGVRYGRGS